MWLQLVTMGNLCLIISERYISLLHPYRIEIYMNSERVHGAIKFIWISTFLYSCIQLTWLYKVLDGIWTDAEDNYIIAADSIFSVVSILSFLVLPSIILFLIFVSMFEEIKKMPTVSIASKKKEETRVTIIFAVMYTTFVSFITAILFNQTDMGLEVYQKIIKFHIPSHKRHTY